ncbi:MAG: SUMF1/EgtB/PvdO family nonheme iron enzyme [Candidatus Promineofilum sp.]|uniref:SUMF1/EgtB/PvdO family nonheme iron enzyme n=1 Tax=Promineifilum sp. TaxID=2664178 RepID=UPI002427AE8C|nr:SUMF1/EgtB/PvdO family nonheme iron enzyme [Promineifilum sp.]
MGSERALRGGSWNNNDQNTRAAYRNNNNPHNRNNNIGFRVVEPLSLGNRKCDVFTESSPREERSTPRSPVSLRTGRASAKSLLSTATPPFGRRKPTIGGVFL